MKNVGIFLSSSTDVSPVFLDEAQTIGRELARANFGIVYGGSNAGCMGRLAEGALEAQGTLIGVIPEMDFVQGLVQEGMNEKILVRDISDRKGKMIERSDAFLIFPGGLGTLDEVSDVLALRQINLHQKPIIFYNYLDYWNPFLDCLETFYQQRMISTPVHELIRVFDQASSVIEYLNQCFRNC
jgi:uncharacterized protein (TIGR00730 family)